MGPGAAVAAREILIRRPSLKRGRLPAFLGTRGDVWDTQWDIFMALIGATAAITLMAGLHDRSVAPSR